MPAAPSLNGWVYDSTPMMPLMGHVSGQGHIMPGMAPSHGSQYGPNRGYPASVRSTGKRSAPYNGPGQSSQQQLWHGNVNSNGNYAGN